MALTWLYPDRCELCMRIGRPPICKDCEREFRPFDEPIQKHYQGSQLDLTASVFPFEGRAAQAVKALKYSRQTALATPMASLLFDAQSRIALPEFDMVVPVPIHWSRRCSRGFNQAEMLCESFPSSLVDARVLKRTKNTRPQVGLNRDERLTNLRGAFEATSAVAGLAILLVDDVTTSGGTAVACAQALRAKKAAYVAALTFCGERLG